MTNLLNALRIGQGLHAPHTPLHLLFDDDAGLYLVGVINEGAVTPYMRAAFATRAQMELHYLEHPLERMRNQPLRYHHPGYQDLAVTKMADGKSLLLAITYSAHLDRDYDPRTSSGIATKPFVVAHATLVEAVHKLKLPPPERLKVTFAARGNSHLRLVT